MKIHVFSTVLLIGTNCFCFADNVPQEVVRLDEQRNAEIRKIDEKYIAELEKIKKRLTKAGDLENALAVDSRIKSIQRQVVGVVGIWNFKNHTDGYVGILTLNSDNTSNIDGGYPGKWDIQDKQLVIRYNHPSRQEDRYGLPIREDKLTGKNANNHKLTITRKTK